MVHPWQGALRKVKRVLRERGLSTHGVRARRWCSLSFEGWLFEIEVELGQQDMVHLGHELADMDIDLPGFLLAEINVEAGQLAARGPAACVNALIIDAPETFPDLPSLEGMIG